MKRIIIGLITLIMFLLQHTVCFAVSSDIEKFTIEFFDRNMNLIDYYYNTSINETYEFPLSAKYLRIQVNPTDEMTINIQIDGDKYGDTIYYDMDDNDNLIVNIHTTSEGSNQDLIVNLQRRTQPRSLNTNSISWLLYDNNGDVYNPDDISLSGDDLIISLPYTADKVLLAYFDNESQYCISRVRLEDGSVFYVNEEPIEILIENEESFVVIENEIDEAYKSYALYFKKEEEKSDNNKIRAIHLGYTDTRGNYDDIKIDCKDNKYSYDINLSNDIIEIFPYVETEHVMANAEYIYDDQPVDIEEAILKLDNQVKLDMVITAENGDQQTYTLNVIKESDDIENVSEVHVGKNNSSEKQPVLANANEDVNTKSYLWLYIIGATVVLAGAIVTLLFLKKRRVGESTDD